MPCEVTLIQEGDALCVCRKKRRDDAVLQVQRTLRCADTRLLPQDACLNLAVVSPALRALFEDDLAFLAAPGGAGEDVRLRYDAALAETDVRLTRYLARRLGAGPEDALLLCTRAAFRYPAVRLQRLEEIRGDTVVLAPCDSRGARYDSGAFRLMEIVCPETGGRIYLKSDHIRVDETLPAGAVRLNKKQRALLGDGVPTRLTAQQHARIEAWQAAAEEAPCDALAYYEADGDGWALRVPVRELPFAGRRSLQEALRAALQPQLLVRPVIASFGVRERRGARALADFFVGRSTLSLTCCRPYENDENACLVRLSAENMKRLGVEEMDQVIVQHAERRVRCRVLAFCGQESLRSTNLHAPEELSVGIPAHLRGELGLTDLHTAVKVDRDTVFLLKKSVNEQVVPVLLALLSLSFFERLPWWLTVGIIVLLLPVLFYLNLSARRSMRG